MNATIEINEKIENNEKIEISENNDSKKNITGISFERPAENEFFKGLVQRAGYYEQFEERRTRITYSVTQTNLEAYS
ncbi:MAG: hypothetical protein FWE54_01345 [Methanimicrococcus sp.]|nr:hypothetical protein [Methanimicrococcus sp.]